ncbi:MAG: hypothetical protein WCO08_07455 [Actinomycetes bacterium]
MRKIGLLVAVLISVSGTAVSNAAVPNFPAWTKSWHAACLKDSFSEACYNTLTDNKVLRYISGKDSGSKDALFVDFKAKPTTTSAQKNSRTIGLSCAVSACVSTLYIKNISNKPWNESLRFELISSSGIGLNPQAFGYPSIDFSKTPLPAKASVYLSLKIPTPDITGHYWRQLWVENLNSPNGQGVGNALETNIYLVPSNSVTAAPTKYVGLYENMLHLWHWDFGSGTILRR